jgi:hypothetical protein
LESNIQLGLDKGRVKGEMRGFEYKSNPLKLFYTYKANEKNKENPKQHMVNIQLGAARMIIKKKRSNNSHNRSKDQGSKKTMCATSTILPVDAGKNKNITVCDVKLSCRTHIDKLVQTNIRRNKKKTIVLVVDRYGRRTW